jgi:hypothetical protein
MKALFIVGLTLLGISFLWVVVAFALDWEKDYVNDDPEANRAEPQFVGRMVRVQARFLWIWHFRGWAAGLAVLGLALMTIAHPH